MGEVKFTYKPTPRQKIFHQTKSLHKLFGGAAGGGKTDALLGELIANAIYYPGIKQLFIRRTFPEIEETMNERLPKMLKSDNPNKQAYTICKNVIHINNSTIYCGFWQDDRRNERYFSSEYDVIAVDELTRTVYKKNDLQKLLSRNRTTKAELVVKGFQAYFIAGTNPGGLGHAYVKEAWIDGKPRTKYDKKDFAFIPSKIEDNPHLMTNDPNYLRRLESMSDTNLMKALRHGERNLFEGQFFPEFFEPRHVVDFIPKLEKPKTILCLDYGFRSPSAVYLLRKDIDQKVYVSNELYETGLTFQKLGEAINRQFGDYKIDHIIADPAIFSKTGNEYSGAEEIANVTGLKVFPADNNRAIGWNLVKRMLQNDTLCIHRNCIELIREIPSVVYDKKKDNDLDTTMSDHGLDAMRYGLMDLVQSMVDKADDDIKRANNKFGRTNTNFLTMGF